MPPLSAQLDAAFRTALNREQWARVEKDRIHPTKIFDWYGDDFRQDGGSVLGFISRYLGTELVEDGVEAKFMDYDWSLNQAGN